MLVWGDSQEVWGDVTSEEGIIQYSTLRLPGTDNSEDAIA